MNWKNLIRDIVREELQQPSTPTPSNASAVPDMGQRQASFARLLDLKAEAGAIEARQSESSADIRRVAQLEAELAEIRQRVQTHRSQLYSDHFANSLAIEREMVILRSTYSPQIDFFMELMRAESSRLLSLKPKIEIGFGEKNLLAEHPKVPRYVFSAAPIIGRRIVAVAAALSRAEELKTLDRTEEELRAELDGLQSGLPSVDGCYELV